MTERDGDWPRRPIAILGLKGRIGRVRGKTGLVAIGFSLFMIALGASIAYAVDLGQVGPVDIQTIGQILLTVGVVGLVLGLVLAATSRGAPR